MVIVDSVKLPPRPSVQHFISEYSTINSDDLKKESNHYM